ncbi:AMP-binding protein [Candidatus Micrarchaeota archaeon]|nr:AMP-binding protein [Candidatus Micrarchaeota archaeon]
MRPRIIPFLIQFAQLKRQQWLDADKIAAIQRERIKELWSVLAAIPHYRDLPKSSAFSRFNDVSDLSEFPILHKEEIQRNPASFINPKLDASGLMKMPTSGSTGTPLEFFLDNDALDHRIALKYLAETEFGLKPQDVFAELSHKKHMPHPILAATGLFRRVPLSVFDPESENLRKLLRIKPDVIGWYPSCLAVLAGLNNSEGNPLHVRQAFCGSETLSTGARRHIESSFSCRVMSQYGATEFSTIAWECPEENSMHVNSTSCIIEIVDGKGKPVQSGTGDILITSLHNRAMPLLRYSIGDRGSWGKSCPCGRGLPVLKTIEGRANDVITLPSGKRRNSVAFDIFYDIPGILAYQLVQQAEDLFVFRYCGNGDLGSEPAKEVKRRVGRGCLGEPVRVEFERVSSLRHPTSGKISTVVSNVRKGAAACGR